MARRSSRLLRKRRRAILTDELMGFLFTALFVLAAGVQWLATGDRNLFHSARRWSRDLDEMPTLLRVNGDTVETSRGAEFPLEHGLQALGWIDAAARRAPHVVGRALSGILGPRLGHFRIDGIDANGTVRAGCHTVPLFAVRWAARQAGAIEAPELDHVAEAVAYARPKPVVVRDAFGPTNVWDEPR